MARHNPRFHTDKRRRPYWREPDVLGKTFSDRQQQDILVFGSDRFSRQRVVDELHCGNFVAAQTLSRLVRDLDITNLDDLSRRYSLEDLFKLPGFGITCAYVYLCALEAKGRDPLAVLDQAHQPVTLSTRKHRVLVQQREAAKATRRSKRRPPPATAAAGPALSAPA